MTNKFPDWHKEVKERFHPEYSVLEALIACLIDGMTPRDRESRKQRVRKANRAITGEDIDRLDEPDSAMTRGLYEMKRRQTRNYLTHLKPEYGGIDEPYTEYEAMLQLAKVACRAVELDEHGNAEKLRKRYAGTYWKKLSPEDQALASEIPWVLYDDFEPSNEAALLEDFRTIARVLEKHDIKMRFDKVFWRTIGNDAQTVPNIDL